MSGCGWSGYAPVPEVWVWVWCLVAGRYGRVQRRLLANHRRRIRHDYATVIFRNYLYFVKRNFGVAPAPPPVLKVCVSAFVAYPVRAEHKHEHSHSHSPTRSTMLSIEY